MKMLFRLLPGGLTLALVVAVGETRSSASGSKVQILAVASTGGNVGQGKIIYGERCAICHNVGGMGPSLKGEKNRKDQAAAAAWIKDPKPPMPKLFPSRLTEKDVNDVAAYVETFTGAAEASTASSSSSAGGTKSKMVAGAPVSGNVAQGKMLYGQSCASCHGATGTEGGVGPSLKGEKSRKDLAAAVAWIKNPKPPMPKLYPAPLGEKEVGEIAAYVETL